MDIIFGEYVALWRHRYALLLVNVMTRQFLIYGISSLSSTSIISALEIFKSEAGQLPKQFHSNFDRKLISGNALLWIVANGSNFIASPLGRQSSNGLAECS